MRMEREAEQRLLLTVTDLKQYTYCPRVVFYTYCLPLLRPTTYKMEAGIAAHEQAGKREQRRTLAAYGLEEGERHFDVWVESVILGLRGRIDLAIEVETGGEREWIPVEYKQTRRRIGQHIRRQLAAYGMMLEETKGGIVRRGFVYSLVTRKAEQVALTERLRREVRETVSVMREMVEQEVMPDPPRSRRPCASCEFRRFCNDVI
ncbi:MAG: CRISPR-associated protein Cas4 [Chloroflexota bacterium]|nr:CRISPR-associated protein Cas4 [Chloroflexota bacterium]